MPIKSGPSADDAGGRKSGTDGTFSGILSAMARLSRIVVVNTPHHVTQRGNGRQFLLAANAERLVYLNLLRKYAELHEVSVLGYCLMSNHIHLVVVPKAPDALARTLKLTHGNYASYWNAAHRSNGHVWQGRFYSCPLDSCHLWVALRYTELNPVRAGLVPKADAWLWSSAPGHCGSSEPEPFLDLTEWEKNWSTKGWRDYLEAGEAEHEVKSIRQCTHTGRPLGSTEFVRDLEQSTHRRLTPLRGGRPAEPQNSRHQNVLAFDAD